ncbi:MAG: hypothetical protein WAR57_03360 [Candidatus Phosphoribacter sp.]
MTATESTPLESPDGPGSPTGTPDAPPANPAPSTIPKVQRPGSSGAPTVVAAEGAFNRPASYPDGVVLAILTAVRAVEEGAGAGAFPGRELVILELELRNGSAEPINLDQVVITAFYGQSRQLAAPVYAATTQVRDFSGTVAAGATATARYAFAIPTSELSAVTMVVDFDDRHGSATFSGSVTVP